MMIKRQVSQKPLKTCQVAYMHLCFNRGPQIGSHLVRPISKEQVKKLVSNRIFFKL